ncbi:MAG: CAP domain-containing protein [bacterium]|nr:CAP domain-containing protein [bacterium]
MFTSLVTALAGFLLLLPVSYKTVETPLFDPILEHQVFDLVNQEREKHGLDPLYFDNELIKVARTHSQAMAEQNFFSHYSPDGHRLSDRINAVKIGFEVVGENLFRSHGYKNPGGLCIQDWMESRGHRDNILYAPFVRAAVGAYRMGNVILITEVYLKEPALTKTARSYHNQQRDNQSS